MTKIIDNGTGKARTGQTARPQSASGVKAGDTTKTAKTQEGEAARWAPKGPPVAAARDGFSTVSRSSARTQPDAGITPRLRSIHGTPVETALAAHPHLAQFAGTTLANELTQGIAQGKVQNVPKDVVVEGPSAFSPESHLSPPGALGSAIDKVAVWTTFQLATDRADRLRLGGEPTHLKYPPLKGSEMVALTKELGPDGKPKLIPGDMVLCGGNGHTGHMAIYVGEDPATGEPQIIHSMATAETQQSWTMIPGNALKPDSDKTGVIKEGLGAFFDRFERDSYVIVRDPRMTDEMRAKGLAHIKELLGKGYDYDLNLNNEGYYCSEMGVEMLEAAYEGSGRPLPWVGTTPINQATLSDLVAAPENFLASPDFTLTAGNKTGWAYAEQVVKTHVSGAHKPGAAAPTQADLEKVLPKPEPQLPSILGPST